MDRLPADWFKRETTPLLVALCRHVATARMISRQIDRIDELFEDALGIVEGVAHLDRLLAMRARETKALADLATKLRLTPQSRSRRGRGRDRGEKARPKARIRAVKATVEVRNFEQVKRELARLSAAVQTRLARNATMAGAGVGAKYARQRVPV